MNGEMIDKVQSEMCDGYCRKPFECTEDELEAVCERCPLLKLMQEVQDGAIDNH